MKKVTFSLFVLAVLWAAAPIRAVEHPGNTFVWEVVSDRATVYLMGSIHFASNSMFPLSRSVERAYGIADYLVVEADPGRETPSRMLELMQQYGLCGPGTDLEAQIGRSLFDRLDRAASRFGLEAENFRAMRPWMAATTLSSFYLMHEGYLPELGLDNHFLHRAAADGKPILELESVERQYAAYGGLSRGLQIALLEAAISDTARPPSEIEALVRAWSAGDPETLSAIIRSSFLENPRLMPVYDSFYTKRNRSMHASILRFLETPGVYFVVLGAGHLGGSGGILDLLSQEGYRIRQLGKD